jgi:acyl-CoA synthetase (AMP-forming)/AMP-acid ligase II
MAAPIPTTNLASLLLQTARRLPEHKALIWRERSWTWAEFAARAQAAAAGLAAGGIGAGDRVLVHARNSVAMFETLWACWLLGAVWVPTNFRLTPPEVAYLARSSRARGHVFDDAFPEHAAAARAANPAAALHVSIGDGAPSWEGMIAAHAGARVDPAEVGRDHPCWFFYTSGTTGRPKAAVLTHSQMGFVVNNHLADLMPGLTHRDASLVVAPLSHGAGIHALAQVARGAASVLLPGERFDAGEAWALVERHRVSNMFTVPTILTMLARHPAVDFVDHSSLRHVIYAGAPMYRADQVHALRKLGPVLVQYFGLGEVTGNITVLPPEWHSIEDRDDMPIGSCGYPRTGMEVAILDAEGRALGPGETGEICVRGNAVFAGYFENEEANAKAFAGGWFHTGDLGHLDARGFLYITGRASDMYISGGSNVYPKEIEEVLLTFPGVLEACVVGMPDAKWGESGVAVLVTEGARELDPAALRAHLEGRLARYKFPARFVFWDELPKSGYGKVPKKDVKARLAAEGFTD